jgi:hypothetical protein
VIAEIVNRHGRGEAIAAALAAEQEVHREHAARREEEQRQRRQRAEAERLRDEREQATALFQGALTFFNPRGTNPRKWAERILLDIDLTLWPPGTNDASIEVWDEAAKALAELVKLRKERLEASPPDAPPPDDAPPAASSSIEEARQ